jgi:hypothetical protein
MKNLTHQEGKIMLIIFLSLPLFFHECNAQKNKMPYFRMGFSLFATGVGTDDPAYKDSGTFFPGLTLNPGFRIINGTGVSVALSSPITLGLLVDTGADDEFDYDDTETYAFGYDLPIAAEITFGLGASNSRQQPFGIMFGYGVGHHRSFLNTKDESGNYSKSTTSFSGQLAYAGLIFPIGRKKKREDDDLKGIIIRFSYMDRQSPVNPYAFSIGAIFLFKSANQ